MGPLRNRSEVDGTFLSTERACALSFPVGCNPGGGKLYSNSFCAGHAVFAQNRQQGLCGQTSTGGIAASAGRGQNKWRFPVDRVSLFNKFGPEDFTSPMYI